MVSSIFCLRGLCQFALHDVDVSDLLYRFALDLICAVFLFSDVCHSIAYKKELHKETILQKCMGFQCVNVGSVLYRVALKSKSLSNDQKVVLKPVDEIRFIAKLQYQSSTVIFFLGIRYCTRDLLSDFNNYA